MLIFAYQDGVTISWWLRMLRGGDLNECHRYWEHGSSVWNAATSIRKASRVSVACLVIAALVIDGPLIQRTVTISAFLTTSPATLSVAISPDPLPYSTGYYLTRAPNIDGLPGSVYRPPDRTGMGREMQLVAGAV